MADRAHRYTQAFLHPASALAFAAPGTDARRRFISTTRALPFRRSAASTTSLKPGPGERFATFVPYGGHDQRERLGGFGCTSDLPVASRADVAIFETGPLPEDIEVTGTAVVHLWFASSAVDTDFVARLIDVYPPSAGYPGGYALNVSEGVTRARFRDSHTTPRLLTPGETHTLRIRLHPTSNLFKAGHRLRLQVASSDYPAYDVNPGTGGNADGAERPGDRGPEHDLPRRAAPVPCRAPRDTTVGVLSLGGCADGESGRIADRRPNGR